MSRAKIYEREALPDGWAALLPCPFCDSPARLTIAFCLYRPDRANNAWVECSRCGATAGCFEVIDQPMTDVEIARKVSRAWNRRGRTQNAAWKLARIAAILGSDFVERVGSPEVPGG